MGCLFLAIFLLRDWEKSIKQWHSIKIGVASRISCLQLIWAKHQFAIYCIVIVELVQSSLRRVCEQCDSLTQKSSSVKLPYAFI